MTTNDGGQVVPPVVYLPAASAPGQGETQVELRQTLDGRTALLAYTALDRLADCCGPEQPWLLVETAKLSEIGHHDVVYLDMWIPEELRHRSGR